MCQGEAIASSKRKRQVLPSRKEHQLPQRGYFQQKGLWCHAQEDISNRGNVVRASFGRCLFGKKRVEIRAGSSEDKFVNSVMASLFSCLFPCFEGSWAGMNTSNGIFLMSEYFCLNLFLQFLFWMSFYLASPDSFVLRTDPPGRLIAEAFA